MENKLRESVCESMLDGYGGVNTTNHDTVHIVMRVESISVRGQSDNLGHI